LVEQLRGERADQLLDLLCQLALLGGQLLDATSERAQGEQRSLQLVVAAAVRTAGREPAEQTCSAERAELAAKRLGGGDEQVTQLAKTGSFCIHGLWGKETRFGRDGRADGHGRSGSDCASC
jgi:hypothetical protein